MSKKPTPEDVRQFVDHLKKQINEAPEGVNTKGLRKALGRIAESLGVPGDDRVKIWFLLDRSGSMELLAPDVIGGFNQFVADQVAKPGKARLTAVQFDGQDAFDVICDAVLIDDVAKLTSSVYRPRASTPLHDAMGKLIQTADRRVANRSEKNKPKEDQLIIVFTDGLENASLEFDRAQVFELIKERTDAGWTFVFMGANQDSYAEGYKMGMDDGNVQNYEATPDNVKAAFASISRASLEFRAKDSLQRVVDKKQFFGGVKEAEDA
jgi:hypothetical protein